MDVFHNNASKKKKGLIWGKLNRGEKHFTSLAKMSENYFVKLKVQTHPNIVRLYLLYKYSWQIYFEG